MDLVSPLQPLLLGNTPLGNLISGDLLTTLLPLPLAEFQSPGPILFKIGPLTIRWYGFLIASALLLAVFLSQFLARCQKVSRSVCLYRRNG